MIHNVDIHKTENVPLVVINLSSDEIYLLKGETMGFMQIQEGEINKENIEKRFITSPTNIDVHRKVELQDADITEDQ